MPLRRRARMLLLAQKRDRRWEPLREEHFKHLNSEDEKVALQDIRSAVPHGVFLTSADSIMLELTAKQLAAWRAGAPARSYHELGRWLGLFLIPISERRKLCFPERIKPAEVIA